MLGPMAEFVVDGTDLVLRLTPMQKFGGLHGDVRVPLTAIRSVAPVRNPWLVLRGWRRSGIALRGVTALGTWRHGDEFDFCYVRRSRPGLQVDVASGQFVRLIVSLPEGSDPVAEANRLAGAAGIVASGPLN